MSSDEAVAVLDAVAKRDEKLISDHVEAFHKAVTGQSDIDDALWACWTRFFDIVDETPPAEQERLVEFVVALKGFREKDGEGKVKVYEAKSGKLWEDLPSFGWVARDRWNFGKHTIYCLSPCHNPMPPLIYPNAPIQSSGPRLTITDVRDPKMTPEELTRCTNKAAFLARLTAISTPKNSLDFSLYGLWALRDAFEAECPPTHSAENAIRNAAVWIEFAGKTLWKLSVDGREFSDRLAIPGDKLADKPWRGFCEERWNVWRAGFEEVGSHAEEEDVAEAKSLEKTGISQAS